MTTKAMLVAVSNGPGGMGALSIVPHLAAQVVTHDMFYMALKTSPFQLATVDEMKLGKYDLLAPKATPGTQRPRHATRFLPRSVTVIRV